MKVRAFQRRRMTKPNAFSDLIIVQVGDRFFKLDDDNFVPMAWELTDVWSRMPDEGNSVWEPL